MRIVLQVVERASLSIENKVYSSINKGYLVLLSYEASDNFDIVKKMIDKILSLRLFMDEEGKTNLSLSDVNGEIMLVSQFTLYADVKKGRRPSFVNALKGEEAIKLYEQTINYAKTLMDVKTGVFGADMKINLINDGPFTLMIDSKDL